LRVKKILNDLNLGKKEEVTLFGTIPEKTEEEKRKLFMDTLIKYVEEEVIPKKNEKIEVEVEDRRSHPTQIDAGLKLYNTEMFQIPVVDRVDKVRPNSDYLMQDYAGVKLTQGNQPIGEIINQLQSTETKNKAFALASQGGTISKGTGFTAGAGFSDPSPEADLETLAQQNLMRYQKNHNLPPTRSAATSKPPLPSSTAPKPNQRSNSRSKLDDLMATVSQQYPLAFSKPLTGPSTDPVSGQYAASHSLSSNPQQPQYRSYPKNMPDALQYPERHYSHPQPHHHTIDNVLGGIPYSDRAFIDDILRHEGQSGGKSLLGYRKE